ncbi:MAG: lysophospholipid acyltransferase family protein [Gemmatimonas sp.]
MTSDSKAPAATAAKDAPAPAYKIDLKTRIAIGVGGFIIQTLARTWRIRAVGRAKFDANRSHEKGAIFTFWHGKMLGLMAEHHRPTTVLISDHRDGEIITQITRRFNLTAVRGSSSKGAARALLQLSRTVNEARDIAITPDGPRGPRHTFAPGALVVSQRTGAPIILLASHVSSAWRLNTWDQFEVPKPFAKIVVAYGEPIVVASDSARDATADTDAVTAALHALDQYARDVAEGRVQPPAERT